MFDFLNIKNSRRVLTLIFFFVYCIVRLKLIKKYFEFMMNHLCNQILSLIK